MMRWIKRLFQTEQRSVQRDVIEQAKAFRELMQAHEEDRKRRLEMFEEQQQQFELTRQRQIEELRIARNSMQRDLPALFPTGDGANQPLTIQSGFTTIVSTITEDRKYTAPAPVPGTYDFVIDNAVNGVSSMGNPVIRIDGRVQMQGDAMNGRKLTVTYGLTHPIRVPKLFAAVGVAIGKDSQITDLISVLPTRQFTADVIVNTNRLNSQFLTWTNERRKLTFEERIALLNPVELEAEFVKLEQEAVKQMEASESSLQQAQLVRDLLKAKLAE